MHPVPQTEQEFEQQHVPVLESALSDAVNSCLDHRPQNPLAFIAFELLKRSASESTAPSQTHDASQPIKDSEQSGAGQSTIQDEWSIAAWVASLGVHEHVACALHGHMQSSAPAASQLAFVRSLAAPSGLATILDLLRSGALLERVATDIHCQAQTIAQAEATTARELVSKFSQDGSSFSMAFSGLSTFFSGLEGLIGSPSPKLADAISREHCGASDSNEIFTTPNYSVHTTSAVEYHFVADPSSLSLTKLGRDTWPKEEPTTLSSPQNGRAPQPLAAFEEARASINARLGKLDAPPFGNEELIAARMYTGPLYFKYNTVLRGSLPTSPARDAERFTSLCKGNRYVTTMHCINSAVVKLSKLQKACRVYR